MTKIYPTGFCSRFKNSKSTLTVLLLLLAITSNAQTWQYLGKQGFNGKPATYTSLVVDGQGNLCVGYTNGGKPAVARDSSGIWVPLGKPIPASDSCDYMQLTKDKYGTLYMIYNDESLDYSSSHGSAVVRKDSAGTWVTVGKKGFTPPSGYIAFESIAFDTTTNTPYMVFADFTSHGECSVMKDSSGVWVKVGASLHLNNHKSYYTTIAVSPTGVPYVAYEDLNNYKIIHVLKDSNGVWVPLAYTGYAGKDLNMTFDKKGTLYLSFEDYINHDRAKVLKYSAGKWATVGTHDFLLGYAYYTTMTLDSSGTPYIAYLDKNGQSAALRDSSDKWVPVGYFNFTAYNFFNSLVFDKKGNLYISYQDYNDGKYLSVQTFAKTPAISIIANTGNICRGKQVTFKATIHANYHYTLQWYKNGTGVGTDSIYYTDTSLISNDKIYCQLSPDYVTPVMSDTLSISVNSPSYSILNQSLPYGGGFYYTFNGADYYTAGTYTHMLTNSAGCDSSAILILTTYGQFTFQLKQDSSSKNLVATWTIDTTSSYYVRGHQSFKLYYKAITANAFTVVTVNNDSQYVIKKPVAGTTYIAYVINSSLLTQSNTAYYNTLGGTCTGNAPSSISNTLTSTSASLSWTGDVSDYEVYYKNISSSSWKAYRASSASYSLTGLSSSSCYVCFVTNRCGSSLGYSSTIDTFYTPAPCTAPSGLTLSAATCHGFTANWASVYGIASYALYFTRTSGTGAPVSFSYRSPTNSYTIKTLSSGTSYSLYVKSICSGGDLSLSSNTATITTSSTGCKDDITAEGMVATPVLHIYPNPNNGQFTIDMVSTNTTDKPFITVQDALGQTVTTQTADNNYGRIQATISNTYLAAGIYFVTIRVGNDKQTSRIVVQK